MILPQKRAARKPLIRVSNELLNDSAFDIAGHIAKRFGVRFGNAEENAFMFSVITHSY